MLAMPVKSAILSQSTFDICIHVYRLNCFVKCVKHTASIHHRNRVFVWLAGGGGVVVNPGIFQDRAIVCQVVFIVDLLF